MLRACCQATGGWRTCEQCTASGQSEERKVRRSGVDACGTGAVYFYGRRRRGVTESLALGRGSHKPDPPIPHVKTNPEDVREEVVLFYGGEISAKCSVTFLPSYKVRVGDYHTLVPEEFEAEYGVEEVVLHPNYRPHSNDYDLALVRLFGRDGRCAVLSRHVLPACLPRHRERVLRLASTCFITGWGDTGRAYSRTLQQASISLLSRRWCEASYPGQFTGRMLCAGNAAADKWVDSCRGDSGGRWSASGPAAAAAGWVVYGVTSWGTPAGCRTRRGLHQSLGLRALDQASDRPVAPPTSASPSTPSPRE
ncbi:hypothetical protein ANANG_G00110710 [Anguilla anguilla]|uniref:trypsin n=1 Tax=Anguilla anguilla TaxID=7936 RepID=A0A9D3S445_ANGAN|nr:hypothetical protein ANANG_G00110710 [Anguilla anguilla]